MRTDGGEQLSAVLGEDQVPGPVAAAAQAPAAGQIGNVLRLGPGRQVAVVVRKADDAVGVAHIEPLRIGPGGIESDAEGLAQVGRENRDLSGLAVRAHATEDLDLAGGAFGQEQVAVGRRAQQARIVEVCRVKRHLEAFGRDGPGVGGPGNNGGTVVHRLLRRRARQVGHGQVAADAGRLVSRVGVGGLAGENGVLWRFFLGLAAGERGRREQQHNGAKEGRNSQETVHKSLRGECGSKRVLADLDANVLGRGADSGADSPSGWAALRGCAGRGLY